ncbi:MAG TPA: cytochrome c [Burkholderiales bacterium]|nr:cytochrome c [Burkholderiales bacterium]
MALLAAMVLCVAASGAQAAEGQGDPKRGEYLAAAGGCVGCHTEPAKDAPPFAGGRALKTPFGTFYGPNITPHTQAGIGRWTEADFVRAMRHGERPDGANYFPAFPYASFTHITDEDLSHLWAYLRSLPANSRSNRPHELGFFYQWRPLVSVWRWLYFTPGPAPVNARSDAGVSRGRYLTQALGHCGECHTPRTFLGGMKSDRYLAGGKGPESKRVPNLTPRRLKSWSDAELEHFLVSGETPDGDSANETMAEVVTNTTSKLTPGDLQALIAYLRSLPPLAEEPKDK